MVRTAPASLERLALGGNGAAVSVSLQSLGAAMLHLTALTGELHIAYLCQTQAYYHPAPESSLAWVVSFAPHCASLVFRRSAQSFSKYVNKRVS